MNDPAGPVARNAPLAVLLTVFLSLCALLACAPSALADHVEPGSQSGGVSATPPPDAPSVPPEQVALAERGFDADAAAFDDLPAEVFEDELPGAEISATRLALSVRGAYKYRGRYYMLPRERVRIRGAISGNFDGAALTIIVKRGGRTVVSKAVTLTAVGGKSTFDFRFRARKGKFTISAELPPETAALLAAPAKKSLTVVKPSIGRGSSGISVRTYQAELAGLGYVTSRNGRFDEATARAFMAFRKMTGMARTFSAGAAVTRKLAAGKGRFRLKHPNAGRHIEVDISRQVMAFADRGRVLRIYHVSTGAPATPTIRGTYRVYRKDYGTNAKGMVHSSYFIRGYAIHGFASVPPYGASHGCVRVPIPNAVSIFNWVKMGTRIDTYY